MRPSLAAALLAASLSTATAGLPALADDTPRTLTLTGRAEVRSTPDMAVISAGTVTEADTAREALSANNDTMRQVLETIRAAGVAEKDIQTSDFSVQPKYTYPPRASDGTQDAPKIAGYTVSNTVTVIVRDLDKLGGVMDAVVSSGVNQMYGLNFTIAEAEPLRNEARKTAVADALARAKLYADAAGVKLGPIRTISEDSYVRSPQPMARMAMEAKMADAAAPVAKGEQVIEATVNIVWELE